VTAVRCKVMVLVLALALVLKGRALEKYIPKVWVDYCINAALRGVILPLVANEREQNKVIKKLD
jgi:hypothetical protein